MIEKSAKIKKIGQKLLQTEEFLELSQSGARIAFLVSDKEKITNHKVVCADCRKVQEQYAWCCPYDFMITVYQPNVLTFSKKQMEILVRHELMHCGIDTDGDEPAFYVAPHDVEEFDSIIEQYGLHWQG